MQNPAEITRIAFCITELDPGGAERNLLQLVKRLDRAIWEPRVYSLQAGGALISEFEAHDIDVVSMNVSKRHPIRAVSQLTSELKQFRPTIVQSFLYHANIVSRLAAWRANVPIVVSGIRVAEKRSKLRLYLDWLTEKFVSRHVCVSKSVARFMNEQAKLSSDKLVTIPNGVDAELFQTANPADLTEFHIPPESTTLLFVGRLDEQKAPFDLLTAVEPILDKQSNLHVLLVGDGPLKSEIVNWISQRKLADRIHLAGYQQHIAGFYHAADCLVLPSLWEGMPNVILEAMAAGLPVIATDVEGCTDIIEHQQTGWLVDSNNPDALRNAISNLLKNPKLMCELASKAQDIVAKEFTHEATTEKYINLYQKLLQEQRS